MGKNGNPGEGGIVMGVGKRKFRAEVSLWLVKEGHKILVF
jgi:hypothetical protein